MESEIRTRRLKRVPLYCELIEPLFRGHANLIQGLPPDAELRRVYNDQARDTFVLVFWSCEFDPVEEGAVIPELELNAVSHHELLHMAEKWRVEGDDERADELESVLYGDTPANEG